eukprot:965789-Amphidinium_carterae.1
MVDCSMLDMVNHTRGHQGEGFPPSRMVLLLCHCSECCAGSPCGAMTVDSGAAAFRVYENETCQNQVVRQQGK